MRGKTAFYITVILLLALLFAAYSGHFDNPFQFDDEHTIVTNTYIRDIHNIPRFFRDATTTSSLPANQAYRPGLTTLNAIDYYLAGGANPRQFHISVFCSYVLLLWMLYLMFVKILNTSGERSANKWVALFITAFYGLHPANAETINYIIARSDSFSTLMVVVGMNLYLYFPRQRRYQLYLLPMIAGFFVKEPALMLIPLVFTYELLFGERESATPRNLAWLRPVMRTLPGLIVGAALFVFARSMTPDTWIPTNISRSDYLLTQPFVAVHYFNNFILPLNLVADTDWQAIGNPFDDRVFAGLAFIALLLFVAFRFLKKEALRPVSFGVFWFFIALLPTSSIFPLGEVLNDHRTFFPYIGLSLAAGWLLARWHAVIKQKWARTLMLCGICAALVLQAYGTRQRCTVWSSGELLWKDVAEKAPGNARGLMNYGNALMAKGQYEEALNYYQSALKLWPYYSYLHTNMGILLGAMGKPGEAERYFRNAQHYGPMNPEVYFYYARWLTEQGRIEDAKQQTAKCLSISPGHVLAKSLMSTLESMKKYHGSAMPQALQKVEKDPTAENYLNLSLAYYNEGQFEQCITAAQKALELKPDYALAYNNICSAYNEMQRWEEAIDACNKALEIKPDFALAANNLSIAVAGQTAEETEAK